MLRRNVVQRYSWYRYRWPVPPPQADGPAPSDAPTNMNSTKSVPFIDPVNTEFPRSIRGNMTRPDVPDDQYVSNWHIITESKNSMEELTPWTATAPYGSYRFRQFPEMDKQGRQVASLQRQSAKWSPTSTYFPPREQYLSKMASADAPSREVSRFTQMSWARGQEVPSILKQRDSGRSDSSVVHRSSNSDFPYKWNTEDWYEYEIAKVRTSRFAMQTERPAGPIRSAEVTYKLVIESQWDHHAERAAADVADFIREVGAQVCEERVQHLTELLQQKSLIQNNDIRKSFEGTKSPFSSTTASYDAEEMDRFVRSEVTELRDSCLSILSLTRSSQTHNADEMSSWPVVYELEPWIRMQEYWSSHQADKGFREIEKSSKHYEFRRFYRVVQISLPFYSPEFETRMYDIRHWMHRDSSVEFQIIHKKNITHSAADFPVEHEPQTQSSEENHRLFSFAVDWKEAPAEYAQTVTVADGDSWDSLAASVGASKADLVKANAGVELVAGVVLRLPNGASKRLVSDAPFATSEQVFGNDSWASIAQRLGCSEKDLVAVNADVDIKSAKSVNVPASALSPRRVVDPLLENEDVSAISTKEGSEQGLEPIPSVPANAKNFAHEYHPRTSSYPVLPERVATDDWLQYTSAFLDVELDNAAPDTRFAKNHLWPHIAAPRSTEQTPFEEDQSWFMNHTPLQRTAVNHPEGYLQDLPLVNNEQFSRSMEWSSP